VVWEGIPCFVWGSVFRIDNCRPIVPNVVAPRFSRPRFTCHYMSFVIVPP
jgi:hypothetical protein